MLNRRAHRDDGADAPRLSQAAAQGVALRLRIVPLSMTAACAVFMLMCRAVEKHPFLPAIWDASNAYAPFACGVPKSRSLRKLCRDSARNDERDTKMTIYPPE